MADRVSVLLCSRPGAPFCVVTLRVSISDSRTVAGIIYKHFVKTSGEMVGFSLFSLADDCI